MATVHEHNVIMPQFYDSFACTMGACGKACCYDWNIVIDKKTYKKYRSMKSPAFTEKCDKYVKRINLRKANEIRYARFVLNEEGYCPFYTDDGLCEIHRDFGEDYLCHTCKVYPRLVRSIDGELTEFSLSMSCPEAARVALFIEDGIDFVVKSQSFERGDLLLKNMIVPEMGRTLTHYLKYGREMRQAAIAIMQKRQCPVAFRLLVIAMMLDEVVRLHEDRELRYIPQTLELYREGTFGEQFLAGFDDIPPNEKLQMAISSLLRMTFRERMGQERGAEDDDARWGEFLGKWEYVLENYFVNFMFSEIFPLKYHAEGLSPYHHALLLAEQYALLKMLLCENYDEAEGLSEKYLLRTFSRISVTNQHTDNPLMAVQRYVDIGVDAPEHLYYFLL